MSALTKSKTIIGRAIVYDIDGLGEEHRRRNKENYGYNHAAGTSAGRRGGS